MISEPLQFYVDKMKRGEKFSLARFGDGELYCMWGAKGQNSNRCRYSPELRQGLLDSFKHKSDPSFIYGVQRVLPRDMKRVIDEYPDVKWHDSEVWSEGVAEGKLYPFIEQLRTMSKTHEIIVVGNDSISKATADIFDWGQFLTVPPYNAYDVRDRVLETLSRVPKDSIVLFSCGMAANVFVAELHGKVDAWLLDVGHIWDPFTGNMSRCDLEDKTMEDINKNLHATDK